MRCVLKKAKIVLVLGFVFGALGAVAAPGDADIQEEATIKKIARSKSYPGGVDEEPLKVQSQLPVVKKDGQNEAEAPEPVDAD